ncbi:MAG: class I SAM-dependent methyltransferase [Candidatus Margulisiibacteriota bacterium]
MKQAQIDYYEGLLAEHGSSFKALDWNSPESQRLRFKILQEIFIYGKKMNGVSLLDVGCGFGDLYGYFKAEGLVARQRLNYTGYDIAPKIIETARKKYPDAKFELKDIMAERHLPSFDYIFCSGIFNVRTIDQAAHLDFVKEMLYRMYDLAGCGLAVNFLSEGSLPAADPEELNAGRYFFFQPEEIIRIIRFTCNRYIMRHDYHAGDFTVFLLK